MLLRLASVVPESVRVRLMIAGRQFRPLGALLDAMTRRVRSTDSVVQSGVAAGMRINVGLSAGAYILGTHKASVQEVMAEVVGPGSVVWDLGANVGFFTLIAARLVGKDGQVVSFEPLPDNIAALRHNITLNQLPNVVVRQAALSEFAGTATFQVSERPTWGRLGQVDGKPDRYVKPIEVEVATIDDLAAGLRHPDVMKIDVEGEEVRALRGGRHTLTATKPILLIELHGTNADVETLLREYGYDVVLPISHDVQSSVTQAHWNATVLAVTFDKVRQLPQWIRDRVTMPAAWPSRS